MSEENAEVSVETTENVDNNVDWEARAKKAEAKIVNMKKSTTPSEEPKETTETGFDENTYKKLREEEKFFDANPDMLEYKDKLAEKVALGYSWKDAKLSVEDEDETIANRKTAKKTNFTSGEAPITESTTYSQDDLKAMSQEQYNRVIKLKQEGKVTIT